MMLIITKFYQKFKNIIIYGVLGILTTLINILIYSICKNTFHLSTILANIWAWILAVLFAYLTNRKWVFESNMHTFPCVVKEILLFFICRLSTGILDTFFMYIFVDCFMLNDIIMKTLSNIIVIVLNYIASKMVVFKSHRTR